MQIGWGVTKQVDVFIKQNMKEERWEGKIKEVNACIHVSMLHLPEEWLRSNGSWIFPQRLTTKSIYIKIGKAERKSN